MDKTKAEIETRRVIIDYNLAINFNNRLVKLFISKSLLE